MTLFLTFAPLLAPIAPKPDGNLALYSCGATVLGPRNASGSAGKLLAANDGDVTDYGPHHGYSWGWLDEPLTVTFSRPVTINKVEALLLDVDTRAYDLRLEAYSGGVWKAIDERRHASGWVTFVFPPLNCEAIRLVFTGTTLPINSYHVVEIAAYQALDLGSDSPLKRAWLAHREEALLGELRLLGVNEALEAVFLNDTAFRRARALAAGQKGWVDLDRDQDPDLIVFQDQEAVIVTIDDDDDATLASPTPDKDSDCWVVDLNWDAKPDRVFDYLDDDSDGDVDREHHYYLHFGWFGRRPGLVLIWDYNDNNRTWTLNRYSYQQERCQWECDFGGNEGFSLFVYDNRTSTWEAAWECPFYFYDPDGDGLAEEALRLEGYGRKMRALRYSMNADNDCSEAQPYDYDFALVALGPVELPEAWLVTTPLRTGRTGPYLPYNSARDAVLKLPWQQALLVWDENDCNVDPHDRAKHERWEGVINSAYEGFPQIGGPACGLMNKRYELDADNSGKLRLYASPVDGRLHLFGAERGTLYMDTDDDHKADRIIHYRDTDADGFFDEWRIEDHADVALNATLASPMPFTCSAILLPLDWRRVFGTYNALLKDSTREHARVADVLGIRLTSDAENDSVEAQRWALERRIPEGFRSYIAGYMAAGDTVRAGVYKRVYASWQQRAFSASLDLLKPPGDNKP